MQDQSIKKGTIIWWAVAILVILGGTWGYFHYKSLQTPTDTGEVLAEDTEAMRIDAKHQFKNGLPAQTGKHIVAGSVNMPTACYTLTTQATVAESMPEQVTIAFTTSTSGDICAQVITAERFKVDFTASENAQIKATWNGKPAILNLIPAGADEDLTNFEVFIKG